MKSLDAVDDDLVRARAANTRTERVEEIGEIDDLGLARGILEHCLALGEHRGHHQILGARHGDGIEHEPSTPQAFGACADVAVFDRHLGAHGLQARDVDVDGTRADRAAAGQRNIGLPESRNQRSEHEYRGAHGFHEFVRRDGLAERTRIDLDVHALVDRNGHPHSTE
jgi:hypothetical protein